MGILNFSQFLNESFSNEIQTDEIQNILGDGYLIKVIKGGEDKSSNKIHLSDHNPHSFCLNYFDKNGNEIDKIWIPREFVKITEENEDISVILHPDNRWLSKKENRIALEDFLEDYLNHKIESNVGESDFIDEISSDVFTLLDVLNLPLEINKIEKKGDFEFEVSFKNGGLLGFSKSGPNNLFKSLKFFKNFDDIQPSLSILKKDSDNQFDFHSPEIGKRNFCCQLDEVPESPYYSYLVKKSMGKESHGDEEALLQYFLQKLAQSVNQPNPELPKTLDDKNFAKELKSVVASFVPDQRLRTLLPS
jgi:hypothetical protein